MHPVSLPDDVFARLQKLAVPLVDTLPDVMRRLLDHFDKTSPLGSEMDSRTPPPTDATPGDLTGRMARERGATIEIDGHRIQAVTVRDMYEQALRYFVDKGHVKQLKALVPLKTSGQRYLIAESPEHPNGNHFVVPARYNGLYMESHKDYRNAVKHLSMLTSKLGMSLRYIR